MYRNFAKSILLTIVLALSHAIATPAQQSTAAPTAPGATPAPTAPSIPPPPAAAPSAPLSPEAEALQLYRTGKFDAAIEAYNKLAASEPALAYAGLTRIYLKQKRVADAASAAAKAIAADPKSADARTAHAEVLFRQGKIADSEEELVDAINAGQKSARAYLDVAQVDRVSSFYRTAKTMIAMAHRLDPGDPDIRREWLFTLPREERLKELKDYLAGETDDDVDDRLDLARALSLLQDESDNPKRTCRQVNKISSIEAPLEPLLDNPRIIRGYGLSVNLNGTNAKLMLDTGAGGILLDRRIAQKAGIKPIVETQIGGVGSKGQSGGYLGYADVIKIGDLEFHDCIVEVLNKRSVLDDDGLIGANEFSHYLVELDLPNRKFRLSELPVAPDQASDSAGLQGDTDDRSEWHDPYIAPEMKSYSPVYRIGHMLLVPTSVNSKPRKLFLLDTGSFDNTITPEAAREVTKIHGDDEDLVKGLNGKVEKVYVADSLSLQFAHLRGAKEDLLAFDLSNISDNVGTEVSGTLGFAMLWMLDIKIDYRDGLVDFTYDQKRSH
jgi:tetratricopeptide (TPR) repeat protein